MAKWRSARRSSQRRTSRVYPEGWQAEDWCVPFEDGEHACIHHGDTGPHDHSLCGPVVFCCVKSASLYMEIFPDSAEAHAEWALIEGRHIAEWMDAGVNVIYFVFCDPLRPAGLLAIGLGGRAARDVLLKRVPVEQYANRADRISRVG